MMWNETELYLNSNKNQPGRRDASICFAVCFRDLDCAHSRWGYECERSDVVIPPEWKIGQPRLLWSQRTQTRIAISGPGISCHFNNQRPWLSSWESTKGRERRLEPAG